MGVLCWRSLLIKVESDTYGNVFAELNVEASPKIAIVGHSDELGLMISYISEEDTCTSRVLEVLIGPCCGAGGFLCMAEEVRFLG